jgi:hypothetical protein
MKISVNSSEDWKSYVHIISVVTYIAQPGPKLLTLREGAKVLTRPHGCRRRACC